jgi:hypothetical protein
MTMISKKIKEILFFGALWGLAEASLGYLLHWLPFGIAGAVMLPIGAFVLQQAWQRSIGYGGLAAVTAVAAMIKSVDFFLPLHSPLSVLNPMTAILLQGLVLSLLIHKLENSSRFSLAFAAAFAWITLFTLAQATIIKPSAGLFLSSFNEILAVIAVTTMLGGTLLHLAVFSRNKTSGFINGFSPKWLYTIIFFGFALAAEVFNSLI